MPSYECRYRDALGRRHREKLIADSPEALRQRMLDMGCYPTQISESGDTRKMVRLSLRDTTEFAETLGMLLDGGHTLKDAMPLLAAFRPGSAMAAAAGHLTDGLDRGGSFGESLELAPVSFPSGFTGLCAVGESTGALAGVMNHLAVHYKRLAALREKALVAMVYPALVLFVAMAAGLFLSTVTLPNLRILLSSVSVDSSVNDIQRESLGFPLIVAGCASILLVLVLIRIRGKKRAGRGLSLRIPGLRTLVVDWNLLGWSFALEILAARGRSLDKALEEAAGTVGHSYLQALLIDAAKAVHRGDKLSACLAKHDVLPPVLAGWLRIGESSGGNEAVFRSVRAYFERRVEKSIDIAIQLVEPVLILLVGGLMILLVGRYLLPLYQMIGSLL